MQKINVHRYTSPENVGFVGYIEPDDRSWIVFESLTGHASFYRCVDTQTGEGQTERRYVNVEVVDPKPFEMQREEVVLLKK